MNEKAPPAIVYGAAFKGAFAGFLTVMVLSTAIQVFFMGGAPKNHADWQSAAQAAVDNRNYLLADLFESLAGVAFGGFIAAGWAGRARVLNGAVSAAMILAVIAVFMFTGSTRLPAWYLAASLGLTVPAGALGGWLRERFTTSPRG
jgi:hypothetical protein